MLTLYTKPGCPFCAKVLDEGERLHITFDERSVANEGVAEELLETGKAQTPFLIDNEREVSLYGSDQIIAHLHEHFT